MTKLGKEILYLTESEVLASMTIKEAVALAEKGVIADGKNMVNGDKYYMNIGEEGFVKPFSGYIEGEEYAFVKTFTLFRSNYEKNLPATVSNVILLDAVTGLPVCFMEGTDITGIKTGSSTAVAVKHLARKDSKILAIYGSGTQARTHLEAINEVMDIEEVRIFSRTSEHVLKFADEMSKQLNLKIIPCKTKKEAAVGADVIITVTTANEVLVEKDWLKPGALICRMGSFNEIDPEIILHSDKFIIDRWKYVSPRVPEVVTLIADGKLKESDVYASWPSIACGEVAGRTSDDEIITYIGLGIWGEYAAILPQVYRNAVANNIGTKLKSEQVK